MHDAVLIAAPLYRLDEDVAAMREAMREASAIVLAGFDLSTDAKPVRYPDASRILAARRCGHASWG